MSWSPDELYDDNADNDYPSNFIYPAGLNGDCSRRPRETFAPQPQPQPQKNSDTAHCSTAQSHCSTERVCAAHAAAQAAAQDDMLHIKIPKLPAAYADYIHIILLFVIVCLLAMLLARVNSIAADIQKMANIRAAKTPTWQ